MNVSYMVELVMWLVGRYTYCYRVLIQSQFFFFSQALFKVTALEIPLRSIKHELMNLLNTWK